MKSLFNFKVSKKIFVILVLFNVSCTTSKISSAQEMHSSPCSCTVKQPFYVQGQWLSK